MESGKNAMWIIPFKKFGMVRVNIINLNNFKRFTFLYLHPSQEFLIQNSPPSIFGTVHYQFQGYYNLKFVSQECRALSDCMDMQAGLDLYWWKRLITSGCRSILMNILIDVFFILFKHFHIFYHFIYSQARAQLICQLYPFNIYFITI